jgi:hypothetical protein
LARHVYQIITILDKGFTRWTAEVVQMASGEGGPARARPL